MEAQKFTLVQTKVSPKTLARLEKVKVDYGFKSTYEMFQSLIEIFLDLADPDGKDAMTEAEKVTAEMLKTFEQMRNQMARLHGTGSLNQATMTDAICIYRTEGAKSDIQRLTLRADRWQMTRDTDKIITTLLTRISRPMGQRVTALSHYLGIGAKDALDYLLEHCEMADAISNDIANEFNDYADGERHVRMGYENKPVRTRSRSIETFNHEEEEDIRPTDAIISMDATEDDDPE